MNTLKFYTYWRSTAAYRVRITLNYKKINYDNMSIDLFAGEQSKLEFKAINPHGRIPSINDDGFVLSQSLAILEYLNEKYPSPSILPDNIEQRAVARFIAQIIVSDMHPLNNSGTIRYLKNEMKQTAENINRWYTYWLRNGFDALESIVKQHSNGAFCVGNKLSMADICLIPQIYNAHKINFDMQCYPTLQNVYEHCLKLSCVAESVPEKQSDYVKRDNIPGSN